jgi:hypothetical protein
VRSEILSRRDRHRSDVRVVPTDGDFPHARRRAVKLACCTTTCCFTFLGGAVGILGGGILGFVRFIQGTGDLAGEDRSFTTRIVAGTFRFLVLVLWYAFLGALIGAGIGFVIDFIASGGSLLGLL